MQILVATLRGAVHQQRAAAYAALLPSLVRSHQAEIIIVKRLIQGHNNVTRLRVEPKPFDKGRQKNDAFILSATLPQRQSEHRSYYLL